MSDNTGVFDIAERMACNKLIHPQMGCVHSVSHLIRHNLKFVLGLYVPLTLAFLVQGKKTLTPALILQALKSGIRSGVWLTVWVPGFSALMCAYYNRYQSHSKLATFAAGFTSGFVAMEIQPAQALKSRVSIYMLNNSIETAYKLMASAGVVKMIPKGECLVFALVCAALSYIGQHHKENVPGLLKKPLGAVEGDPRCEKPVVFLTKALDSKLKIPVEFATSPAGYVISGTVRALIISLGIKVVGVVIALIKKVLKKEVPAASGSWLDRNGLALFMVIGTALYRMTRICVLRRMNPTNKLAAALPGLASGLSSFFWPSVTISQLCLAQTLDSIWTILTTSGRITSPRKGQSILFGLSTAILFYAAVFNKGAVRPSTLNMLGRLSDSNFVHTLNKADF